MALSAKQIEMLKTLPEIDQDLVKAYEKNNLKYTPTETVKEKVLPPTDGRKSSISAFSSALEDAVSLARNKRQSKDLDFLGGVIPKGAVSAGTFTSLLSNLNQASSNFTDPLVQGAMESAQADENARLEQANSIRDLALSLVQSGTSQEVVQGILQAKDLDSAIAMASGAMNAKGKMKTEQIGTKLVQYDPNDPEGTVRVLFDGGSGSGGSGKAEKPSIVTISPEKKQSLVSAGFNAQEIDTIESDVSEFGLQAVLDGLENEEEKQAVRAVYNKSASKENEVFLNEDYFKSLFGEEELKKVAKEAGSVTGGDDFIPFNESGDVEAYLKQLMSTVELYRQAGYSDKEILTKMQ